MHSQPNTRECVHKNAQLLTSHARPSKFLFANVQTLQHQVVPAVEVVVVVVVVV